MYYMALDTETIKEKIAEIEAQMAAPDFWSDKVKAQEKVKEHQELKAALAGVGKYDRGNAIATIFAGAGGDDAEDFARMLFGMYEKFIEDSGFEQRILHENQNDRGGYRNITFEVRGKNAYGTLKNESGVHRLVRISPFNAAKKRHTSFVMVEVVPEVAREELALDDADISVEFSRSSGPGGQNVNKRETAVRVVHTSTGLSAHSDSERSQVANKEKALAILRGKLFRRQEEERQADAEHAMISKTTAAEWGSQIRSYVLHPYKLVKDHRTGVEVRDVDRVLNGDLDAFIKAEQTL